MPPALEAENPNHWTTRETEDLSYFTAMLRLGTTVPDGTYAFSLLRKSFFPEEKCKGTVLKRFSLNSCWGQGMYAHVEFIFNFSNNCSFMSFWNRHVLLSFCHGLFEGENIGP